MVRKIILTFSALFMMISSSYAESSEVKLKTKHGTYNGKLLMPEGKKKCPVVLIHAGSGPTDMDGNQLEVNMKNNSLKFLAEGLAKKGIATLRFDKQAAGSSKFADFDQSKITFDHYIEDVKGILKILKKEYKFKDIYMLGHSEGALIGMIASIENPDVTGYVSVAGPGFLMSDIIEKQVKPQSEWLYEQVVLINDSLKAGKMVKNVPPILLTVFRPSVQPFLISCYKYNPQDIIAKLNIPILIVQGTTDMQVTIEDAEQLHKANPKSEKVIIENMNHVLKNCATMDPAQQQNTYMDPNLPVMEELIDAIANFIKK